MYAPSSDSRLIYVSTSGNDGAGAPTNIATQENAFDPQGTIHPYSTISAAVTQLRSGYPDWLLLKRGDTWTENLSSSIRSGQSALEPMVTACYGTTGERPVLECGRSDGVRFTGTSAYHVIYGIDFYAHTRDPSHSSYIENPAGGYGIRWLGGGNSLVIDDCRVRFFVVNVSFEPYGGGNISDIVIKKSIITDSYKSPTAGHSQGLFMANVNGVLIENNVFDHNGWNELIESAKETQFNHNLYFHEINDHGNNIIFRRNISTRAAATGCHGRPGGTYHDNFFSENSIGLGLGFWNTPLNNGVATIATDNVILAGKRQETSERATTAVWGLTVRDSIIGNGGAAAYKKNNKYV